MEVKMSDPKGIQVSSVKRVFKLILGIWDSVCSPLKLIPESIRVIGDAPECRIGFGDQISDGIAFGTKVEYWAWSRMAHSLLLRWRALDVRNISKCPTTMTECGCWITVKSVLGCRALDDHAIFNGLSSKTRLSDFCNIKLGYCAPDDCVVFNGLTPRTKQGCWVVVMSCSRRPCYLQWYVAWMNKATKIVWGGWS